MANSKQGAARLTSSWGFKVAMKGARLAMLRNNTLTPTANYDMWKDWWLGSGGKVLKMWTGVDGGWITISTV
jgi:hypothetical protein